MNDFCHLPVMADEIVSQLAVNRDGAFIDLTAGLGGHLYALSKVLSDKARLYGIDRDSAAVKIASENLAGCPQRVVVKEAPYSTIDELTTSFEDSRFDGMLLDLGISSMQIDDASRGFSFRHDGPLDMRFDPDRTVTTAADIVNRYSEKELADIFFTYGEERKAKRIAKALVMGRQTEMIQTTAQLKIIVTDTINPPHQTKSLARIFQALRIAVNGELDELKAVLPKIINLLNQGGRLAVLSYHSLEDRIVKRFFRQIQKGCTCPAHFSVCVCGIKPSITILTKKALIPSEDEIKTNPRARSAKLRVAQKI